jgi:glucose-6-phosphate isomerase
MEGVRDKTVTFIKIADFENDMRIPSISLANIEDLDYVDNIQFKNLINLQADATIEAIENLKDIPCDVIMIDRVDEFNIAKLMYTFQLLTSVIGKFVQINTYDQPGVEFGKKILKNQLILMKKS